MILILQVIREKIVDTRHAKGFARQQGDLNTPDGGNEELKSFIFERIKTALDFSRGEHY